MKKAAKWVRFAVIAMAAVFSLTAGAYAEGAASLTFERLENSLVLKGTLKGKESEGTLLVICPDKTVEKEYNKEIDYTGIIAAIDVFDVENNEMRYVIPIGDEGPFGTYTAILKYDGEQYEYSAEYTRNTPEFIENFRKIFNASENKTQTIIEYKDLTLIDENRFMAASEELRISFENEMNKLAPIGEGDITDFLTELSDNIERVNALNEINQAADEDEFNLLLKENISGLRLLFDITDEKNAEYKNQLYSGLPITSVSILAEFNESYLLRELNAASWGGYEKLIKSFSQIGIKDYDSEVKNFTAEQEEKMLKEIANASPFSSTSQFCEVFEEKKTKVKNGEISDSESESGSSAGGGRGSGGGGGGGGGGSSFVSTGTAKPSENEKSEEITAVFDDLESTPWAEEAILYLAKLNVVSGKGNKMFAPNDNVKREEFIKMILNAFNITVKTGKTNFSDVESESWYENYIYTATEENLITGIDEKTFGTGQNLSRQDAAVILSRVFKAKGKKFNITVGGSLPNDFDYVEEYAAESVQNMFRAGMINGDENRNFKPQDSLTRAEAAKMIYGILKGIE